MTKFNLVAVGGTFDHFHRGHKDFLNFALKQGKKIIIGLTSDYYIKKNAEKNGIEPYKKRKQYLNGFIEEIKVKEKTKIIAINDLFGPTLKKNLPIDAIVVSENSLKGAEIINMTRVKNNQPPLIILMKLMVKGEDGIVISSKRIRNGEINRDGKPYINHKWLFSTLVLPDTLRADLKKPMGTLYKNGIFNEKQTDFSRIITVGDFVTKSFNDRSFEQKISVVDYLVNRKNKFSSFKELGFKGDEKVIEVSNPAGCLTSSLFKSVSEVLDLANSAKRLIFKINGEEDLSVLPFLLLAPLGFIIFYGQPGFGIVKVAVTEENKEKAYKIVNSFTTRGH